MFAAILTSILHASGIPAHPVTNYGNHHDRGLTDDRRAVSRQYDNIVQADESTWNFHESYRDGMLLKGQEWIAAYTITVITMILPEATKFCLISKRQASDSPSLPPPYVGSERGSGSSNSAIATLTGITMFISLAWSMYIYFTV